MTRPTAKQLPPKCMTPEQAAGWLGKNGYCEGCTPSFKGKSIDAGTCQYPKTVFRLHHGGLEGERK